MAPVLHVHEMMYRLCNGDGRTRSAGGESTCIAISLVNPARCGVPKSSNGRRDGEEKKDEDEDEEEEADE